MTRVTAEAPERPRTARRRAGWAGGLAALLVALIGVALLHPASALAAPQASSATVQTSDPSSITFKVRVTADADIATATLNYKTLNPTGNSIGGSLRAEASGRTADVSVQLQTNNNERYNPIGTLYKYSWTIVDKNGATTTTPEQDYTFLDGRFQWQSKTREGVTVYWYASEPLADRALNSAIASIKTSETLLSVKLGYPIRLIIWRNSAEAKAAQQPRSASFDSQIVTGGSRVGIDLLHIYDPLDGFDDVVRHETGHILTKVAGDGSVATLPSWIDEGTAVYVQTSPGAGYEQAVKFAIAADSVIRLRNMSSNANQANQVNLFYGQSWSVVKFMVDTYGQAKFAAIFKSIKDGSPIDDALQANINVDQDGLYTAWRAKNGLKTIDFPPVARATSVAGVQATRAPLGIPTSVNSAESTSGSGGAEATSPAAAAGGNVLVVGIGAVVVAAILGFFAWRLSRKPSA